MSSSLRTYASSALNRPVPVRILRTQSGGRSGGTRFFQNRSRGFKKKKCWLKEKHSSKHPQNLVQFYVFIHAQSWRTQNSIVQRNATFTALQRTVTVTFDAGHTIIMVTNCMRITTMSLDLKKNVQKKVIHIRVPSNGHSNETGTPTLN